MRRAAVLALLFTGAPGALLSQDGAAGSGALASGDPRPVSTLHRGFPAFSQRDLPVFGFVNLGVRSGVLSALWRGRPVELYAGATFFRYGNDVYQLANAPYLEGGEYWVPAELVEIWSPRARSGESVTGAGEGIASASDASVDQTPDPVRSTGPAAPLRVVIDPGHGGRDPGAIGRRGTREKDIVLAISRRVHALLQEAPGIESVLTRDRDVLIPLQRRSSFAVDQQADLFISIHANASRSSRARGFETYFLGEGRTELSREVAMRENSAVQYEEEGTAPRPEDLQFILARLNLNSFQRESGRFGGYVQNALRGGLSSPDRGVKQNVFWVLVGATGSMPSVLVEIGFLTNADEERFMRSENGQRSIAEAIADAVVAYRDDYGVRLQAAGASQ